MSHMMQPRVVVLKEGSDTSQGKPQLLSNINACEAVAGIVATTLGPGGMDKLIHEQLRVTISNDGATIINLLDIVHPAAKVLVDIAKSQDDEVGDGTTSVTLLAVEFLKCVKPLIEDGIHPRIIIRGFRQALAETLKQLRARSVSIQRLESDEHKQAPAVSSGSAPSDLEETGEISKDMLIRCAATTLNSKLISGHRNFFARMVVDAIGCLDQEQLDIKLIGMKRVPGGSVTDSFLVRGVAFQKTFSYAGFEQQPKYIEAPKVLLLNVELELKSERQNAEIRISDPKQYQSIVDAEWNIIYSKLDKIVASGARVVLSRLPIGDLATQYFADRQIFCAGRVPADDLARVASACGCSVQTSLESLGDQGAVGSCGLFQEKQVGPHRFNLFTDCPSSQTATIVLRGGAEQFIAESERSLHDALMIVKRTTQHRSVVGGGGAIEMQLSRYLRNFALEKHDNKLQLIISAYGRALEIIPRQLSQNAGFDSTDILNQLRAAHAKVAPGSAERCWMGVNIDDGGVRDTLRDFVWEPALVKLNALAAATEAACVILSIDETVKNPGNENPDDRRAPAPRGHGMR